jgi:predicted DNA-binding WGR domain protein
MPREMREAVRSVVPADNSDRMHVRYGRYGAMCGSISVRHFGSRDRQLTIAPARSR